MYEEKRPYKIYSAGGYRFPVYLEYDLKTGESYPNYPDFEVSPQYTHKGRPFATAEQDACSYAKPKIFGKAQPADCGDCGYFYREHTPYDIIGICMCENRRLLTENKNQK